MIFPRRGIEIERYPSVKRHLEGFRPRLEPKPEGWRASGPNQEWAGRKEGLYNWYEIQDSTEYWNLFAQPKIIYQEIQFPPRYCFDDSGSFSNNKTFFIPSRDFELLSILNSQLLWWHNWRFQPHMKDEALTPMGFKMEQLPITSFSPDDAAAARKSVGKVIELTNFIDSSAGTILDWLRHEFGLEKPGQALSTPQLLDAETFTAAARKALPRSKKLSAAEIARLKQEHAATVEPARRAANEALALERELSDLVNAAYGLTPEEIALMWKTARRTCLSLRHSEPQRIRSARAGESGFPATAETENTASYQGGAWLPFLDTYRTGHLSNHVPRAEA